MAETEATHGSEAATTLPPLLQMTGIRKSFGPVVALDNVDFEVRPREVHGLLGGNGAGKTTLMNVLYGLYRADAGEIQIDGRPVIVRAPRDAIDRGIGMVHQTFLQVDTYTVTENVVLGTDQRSFPVLRLGDADDRIRELSDRFGLKVEPRARVQDLSVGIRQRVEILKALFRGARVLVLDEPTTNLTPQEVDSLFNSLRAIVDEGMSVVFITHKIREALGVCDRMSVMRDGRRLATVARTQVDARRLAALMVGEALDEEGVTSEDVEAEPLAMTVSAAESAVHERRKLGESRLRVRELTVRNEHGVEAVKGVGFGVRAGEIVGITGVAGNGQVELAEALAGVRLPASGTVEVDGRDRVGEPTANWLAAGVAYVPEDRGRDGILPASSVAENLILGSHRSSRFRKHGFLDWSAVRKAAGAAISTYSIRTPSVAAPAGALSGGNIQRLILARAFAHQPRLLILHNPTRGLDIQSTQFVYNQVLQAATEGTGVLLISEDLDEVLHLADRTIVIYSGALVGERSKDQYDAYEIGRLMTGVRGES